MFPVLEAKGPLEYLDKDKLDGFFQLKTGDK